MYVNPVSEPTVTEANVISTVAGEQTAGGFVIIKLVSEMNETTTGLIVEQPFAFVPLI